jgi:hypothetical protein
MAPTKRYIVPRAAKKVIIPRAVKKIAIPAAPKKDIIPPAPQIIVNPPVPKIVIIPPTPEVDDIPPADHPSSSNDESKQPIKPLLTASNLAPTTVQREPNYLQNINSRPLMLKCWYPDLASYVSSRMSR